MLQLIIGNKNYSSWSLRPWLAMKVAGIEFHETLISLEAADFKQRLTALSGAGKVPVLIDGDLRVGNRWRSSNISPRNFRMPACGRAMRRRARTPAPSPVRCMPGFKRCAGSCR